MLPACHRLTGPTSVRFLQLRPPPLAPEGRQHRTGRRGGEEMAQASAALTLGPGAEIAAPAHGPPTNMLPAAGTALASTDWRGPDPGKTKPPIVPLSSRSAFVGHLTWPSADLR